MFYQILFIIFVLIIFSIIGVWEFLVFQKNKKEKQDLIKREQEAKYRIYEISILNELNDKIGYSLGAENIADVIIRSLSDIVEYSLVSYILPLPEKIIFRADIKDPVSYNFVEQIKLSMKTDLSVALGTDFKNLKIEEKLWGNTLSQEQNQKVGSIFSVPLVISGKVVGLLGVANLKPNFYNEKQISTVQKIAQLAGQAVTRLQEVIEAENSKLNAMVASMSDGVVMTDTDYRILVANPSAKKFVGLEEKQDLSINDFINGLSSKIDLKDKIEEGVRLDKVFVSEEISVNEKFFKIVVSPVKGKNKTLGCVIVFRDITKEKEIEQIKADFTSMIVHELRSPLDSIKKILEMIRNSKLKKQKQEEYLQLIYGSSSDMLELVNNLLDVAKIEAGKFELKKQPSDIKEIIKGRILFFDIASKNAKINLQSQIQENIPENINFDPHMVSEVLNNFISNAIKFNIENGNVVVQALIHKQGQNIQETAKQSKIEWFLKKDSLEVSDSLVVAVTNTGRGIPGDQIGKLFNKFFQVKTDFAQKQGTGLGLAIAKSIAESHGGIVGVDSIEGKGATFYFTLPLEEDSKNSEILKEIPIKK